MVKIFVKERESIEIIIKKFKSLVEKSKLLEIYKEKLFYKKPSILKKQKKKSVIKNLQKLSRKKIILNRRLF